jgi:hypothetical protein
LRQAFFVDEIELDRIVGLEFAKLTAKPIVAEWKSGNDIRFRIFGKVPTKKLFIYTAGLPSEQLLDF